MTEYKNIAITICTSYLYITGLRDEETFTVIRNYHGAADVVERIKLIHEKTGVWASHIGLHRNCVDYGWQPFLEGVKNLLNEAKIRLRSKELDKLGKDLDLPIPGVHHPEQIAADKKWKEDEAEAIRKIRAELYVDLIKAKNDREVIRGILTVYGNNLEDRGLSFNQAMDVIQEVRIRVKKYAEGFMASHDDLPNDPKCGGPSDYHPAEDDDDGYDCPDNEKWDNLAEDNFPGYGRT